MTPDGTLSIGEVAARTGVRPSALRWYESVGLLPPPPRVSGRRRYDELTVGRVALVQLAQRAGFHVDEIRTLLHGFAPDVAPAARWRQLAARKVEELDALIDAAQRMRRVLDERMRCDCREIDECARRLADRRAAAVDFESTRSRRMPPSPTGGSHAHHTDRHDAAARRAAPRAAPGHSTRR
jgi:MerR family redox-sensitive transcriptional activator SoxR